MCPFLREDRACAPYGRFSPHAGRKKRVLRIGNMHKGREIKRIFPNDNYSRLKESWLLFWSGKTSTCNGRLNGVFAPEKGCYSNVLFNMPTAGFFIRKLAFCQLRKIQEIWR